MTMYQTVIALMFTAPFSYVALAQDVGTGVQRNINQESRIEQGLKSGQLSADEAAKLERGEADRLNRAQNAESGKINALKHNDVTGNPNSASSQRMQTDVQRNINQQSRIEQGVQSGSLSNKEVSHLERGQVRVERAEARAGADGHVSAGEQARIQHKENKQSRKIFRDKHNNR